jgi:hypothetical protein
MALIIEQSNFIRQIHLFVQSWKKTEEFHWKQKRINDDNMVTTKLGVAEKYKNLMQQLETVYRYLNYPLNKNKRLIKLYKNCLKDI